MLLFGLIHVLVEVLLKMNARPALGFLSLFILIAFHLGCMYSLYFGQSFFMPERAPFFRQHFHHSALIEYRVTSYATNGAFCVFAGTLFSVSLIRGISGNTFENAFQLQFLATIPVFSIFALVIVHIGSPLLLAIRGLPRQVQAFPRWLRNYSQLKSNQIDPINQLTRHRLMELLNAGLISDLAYVDERFRNTFFADYAIASWMAVDHSFSINILRIGNKFILLKERKSGVSKSRIPFGIYKEHIRQVEISDYSYLETTREFLGWKSQEQIFQEFDFVLEASK